MQTLPLENIRSGRRPNDRMTLVAERFWRFDLFTRSFMQPVAPIEPPAPLRLLRIRQNRVRSAWIDPADHVRGFLVGRGIEKALEMAAVRQYESRCVADDQGGLVNSFPWRDMIRDSRDH